MKAVIFDFDGLIVDTESIWFDVFQEILQEYGVDLSLETFSKCVGSTDDALYEHMEIHATKPFDRMEIDREAEKRYQDFVEELVLRNGVLDYLKEAKRLGIHIGLASSSGMDWVKRYLTRFGILSYFDVMWTGDQVSEVKPDPELYERTIDSLQLQPEEAVVFEDSGNGLLAARRAGIPCVVVPNRVTRQISFEGYALKLSSMEEKSLREVLAYLNN
ncbi:HAD family hydrolase [Pontibacillus marinus BH030004 = DSM 16465]|uniref:HAD family hydrolase n=1 Tax=Pontibacillus marinus BH030004 = DSM 16465 TaxID=1385511 RepID=A0A0A5I201_9BACI|nr:HAD family hydrolase [Pontibacillus marinus BH030004 = DSM 16465]